MKRVSTVLDWEPVIALRTGIVLTDEIRSNKKNLTEWLSDNASCAIEFQGK